MSTQLEPNHAAQNETAQALAQQFAASAVERDEKGGTPKAERDAIRASGLLALSIPAQYGGTGATWAETLDVVRTFARVDSSIAHLFGFHHLLLATVRLFGRPDQWEPWLEQTARNNWFWGNTLNPLDTRTVAQRTDGGYEFSGRKSFCSGALDSDMLVASGLDAESRKLLIAAIPTSRAGITLIHELEQFRAAADGQRQRAVRKRANRPERIATRVRAAEHAFRVPTPVAGATDLRADVSWHWRGRVRGDEALHAP